MPPMTSLPRWARFCTIVFPPLALVVLWRSGVRLWSKLLGSLGLVALSVPYAALIIFLLIRFTGLEVEWRGGYIPALTYHKTRPDFTALELVLMGRGPHLSRWALASRADVARAREALEELGIGALAGRALGALSGGERRLVMLARALTQAPELLLLDEPTAFLDVRHQVQTLALVRRRVEAGMAAVAVLHDVNLAAAFATKALLLGGGRVLGSGDAGEVLATERLQALYGVSIATATSAAGQRLFGPATG